MSKAAELTREELVERLWEAAKRNPNVSPNDASDIVETVLAELKALGLVLVPVEPTEEMIKAMPHFSDTGREIWRNALSSSPFAGN